MALPRRESKTGRGHKVFTVEGDPSMPFDEAARRRDFTINAIGWDPLTDEFLDPFGGRSALERRLLRIVEHRPPTPLLLGRHLLELGVPPGPRMGELLRTVYELQLDGAVTTIEDAQREARRLLS